MQVGEGRRTSDYIRAERKDWFIHKRIQLEVITQILLQIHH